MTDSEARVFVAQSVFEVWAQRFPQSNMEKLHDAAHQLVNAILNAYQGCLLESPTEDKEPS